MRSLQNHSHQKRIDMNTKVKYNLPKPRDLVAKDLRTPKYRMRVCESKVNFTRKVKHKKEQYYADSICE